MVRVVYVVVALLCLPSPFVSAGVGYAWTFQYGALPLAAASAALALSVGSRRFGLELTAAILWGLCALSISLPVSAWILWHPALIWTETALLGMGAAALLARATLMMVGHRGPDVLPRPLRATMAAGVALLAIILGRLTFRWVASAYGSESEGLAAMVAYAREFQVSVFAAATIIAVSGVVGRVSARGASLVARGV
jgi:hypothetical protein